MSGQVWLTPKPGERRKSPGPKPRGQPRVEDGRALSGLLYILRNGLRGPDAPSVYGPHRTLTNRFVRWSRLGVLARIFRDLAQPGAEGDTLVRDGTHLKAHRPAARLTGLQATRPGGDPPSPRRLAGYANPTRAAS